ncbi:MAG TPA: T9SS type A sorting domain-containing protein, partial [Prolixibacteraceae bacterium]|nr:T9SS type A sorting domain-containing protein [Prolixibacteraceae bacterium]
EPGDVFVLGGIKTDRMLPWGWWPDYPWTPPMQLDVQFNNVTSVGATYSNPWGEEVNNIIGTKWKNTTYYIFKILNDSIKLGLKAATDPNDFELVETFGMADGSDWVIGGDPADQITNYIRKPEIWKGETDHEASFGSDWENSQWIMTNWAYWQALNVGWPQELLNINKDLGQHFFTPPSHYKSTVSSVVYKVSPGYSMNEEIRGPRNETTVADFMGNLIKAHDGQVLKVVSVADGSELATDATLSMNDTLVVMSADSVNFTKYRLDVTEEGLSSNAVLTSSKYTIEIIDEPMSVTEVADNHIGSGTITGFEYGTQLQTILNNIQVPIGASLNIVNANGAYVPTTMLNFDTAYVAVTVNHETYFEVVAENGSTTILYQLLPEASESSAFLTSDVYSVAQRDLLIEYIPGGTSVKTFLSNVVPSLGASIKVVDKYGMEKTLGNIVQDDRVVVTSPNATVQTVYYISMLATEYVQETLYLAYVTSNVYAVDQLDRMIKGATGTTELATFYNRIDPSMGATAIVVDADGNEKMSGDLDGSDMLKVVSADGKFTVMYAFDLGTSSDFSEIANINVYPNPTDGRVNISGVEPGGRIQVYNSTGARISDINVRNSIETVSLNNQPSGMYLIVVSNDSKKLGQFKVLRR